jgi:hypothetical protein
MSREPVKHLSDAQAQHPVVLEDGRLVILDLAIEGTAHEVVRAAVTEGRDPELVVRQMLEVGGAVLLHGAGKATIDAVSAEVDRLMALLAEKSSRIEAVRRIRDKTSFRGLDFEDVLAPVLDKACEGHGDTLEHVAGTPGITGTKTGDFVVTLNPRTTGGSTRRVVVEAKKQPLTLTKALEELDAAMLNREADAALLVFAHPDLAPLHGRLFRAFPDRRLMAVWDAETGDDLALDVACQLARSLAIANDSERLNLDKGRLGDDLAQLVGIIENAAGVKRGLQMARRGLNSAEEAYESLREDALAVLYALEDLLAAE